MADSMRVDVTNLVAFRNQLHFLGVEFGKELKTGFLEIAEDVAKDARAKVAVKSGDAAASIKARAIQSGASIVRGGQKAPYFAWLDWGGTTGRGHKNGRGQGAIRRPFISGDGRYIYKTIKEHKAKTRRMVRDLLARVARDSGVDFTGDF